VGRSSCPSTREAAKIFLAVRRASFRDFMR
jgi:hypothetical protein